MSARHYPSGPWLQPHGKYVGQCDCGRSFEGASRSKAQDAWFAHSQAARTEGRAGGGKDLEIAKAFLDAWNRDNSSDETIRAAAKLSTALASQGAGQ